MLISHVRVGLSSSDNDKGLYWPTLITSCFIVRQNIEFVGDIYFCHFSTCWYDAYIVRQQNLHIKVLLNLLWT